MNRSSTIMSARVERERIRKGILDVMQIRETILTWTTLRKSLLCAGILFPLLVLLNSCVGRFSPSTTSKVEKTLEERYGVEFETTHIGDRIGTEHAKVYLYQKDNPRIQVTAYLSDDGTVTSDYVEQVVAADIEERFEQVLASHRIASKAKAVFTGYSPTEEDFGSDINDVMKKYGIDSLYVKMIFNKETDSGKFEDAIIPALEDASSIYDFAITAHMFVFEEEQFWKCKEEMEEFPNLSVTMIEDCGPIFKAYDTIESGTSQFSAEDFASIFRCEEEDRKLCHEAFKACYEDASVEYLMHEASSIVLKENYN